MNVLYHLQHATELEDLGVLTDCVSEYDESIETASDDQLRFWILSKRVTDAELSNMLDAGFTLQEIAADLEAAGHTFS